MNAALMLATAMGRRIPADLQTLLKGDGGVRPFSLNEEAEEFIWQKLAQIPWKAKGHQQYATLRKLIISDTDFPVKLLANPSDHNLYILTTLAETHESRMKLAQLGLASAIECVARRTASDGNQTSPNHWVWTLFNHIEYIENVPASVVTALLGRLDWNRNAIPCLYRIALRGPSTKSLMEPVCEPLLQRLPAGIQLDIYRLQEHSCIMLAAALYHATSDERLLNLFHLEDDLAGVRARAKYFHYRCSLERNSRQHLAISGYMRPGESILTYMGLCSSNDATVCYLAAVHLASILTMASPHLFQFEPFDTVGARLMTQQAVKAQAELNSKLTGIQYEVQPNVHPFTLLTQCILNLTEHENKHVRDMGKNCLGRLPNRILIKVPWSPSMHRFFDADEDNSDDKDIGLDQPESTTGNDIKKTDDAMKEQPKMAAQIQSMQATAVSRKDTYDKATKRCDAVCERLKKAVEDGKERLKQTIQWLEGKVHTANNEKKACVEATALLCKATVVAADCALKMQALQSKEDVRVASRGCAQLQLKLPKHAQPC